MERVRLHVSRIKSRPGRPVTSKAPRINSTRINVNKTAGSESFETFVLILLAETRRFLLENFDKTAEYELASSLRISETRYRGSCRKMLDEFRVFSVVLEKKPSSTGVLAQNGKLAEYNMGYGVYRLADRPLGSGSRFEPGQAAISNRYSRKHRTAALQDEPINLPLN